MASDLKRMSKTQSLSLRLDPKTRFVLDFMARIRGQSITMVIERAIKEAAEQMRIGPQWDERGNEIAQRTWADFWDASEGVRTLKLLAEPEYPTTFDEDELRAFTLAHWQFFYVTSKGYESRRGLVEILWPSMDRYLQIWREKKSEEFWAAGAAMRTDIKTAGVQPPEWPPQTKPDSRPSPKAPNTADLDDDIPF